MRDPAWTYAFLCASAFVAGVINSVAGGGTLLTFPALMTVLAAAPSAAVPMTRLLFVVSINETFPVGPEKLPVPATVAVSV